MNVSLCILVYKNLICSFLFLMVACYYILRMYYYFSQPNTLLLSLRFPAIAFFCSYLDVLMNNLLYTSFWICSGLSVGKILSNEISKQTAKASVILIKSPSFKDIQVTSILHLHLQCISVYFNSLTNTGNFKCFPLKCKMSWSPY